jgi:hypothetical protein
LFVPRCHPLKEEEANVHPTYFYQAEKIRHKEEHRLKLWNPPP